MRSSILFLALLLLSGCDIVNDPVTGPGGVTPPPEGETKRRVLIEDFTGFRCPNCPSAAVEAENIKDAYDEGNVVLVAVHATSVFAAPVAPIGDGYFDTDFRTDDGDAYLQAFPLTSLPKGMVNRTPYNGTIQMNYTAWSAASASILSQTAKMDLWFSDLTYDGSNTVAGEVKIAVLEALGDTTYNMVVYLTEDHIFDD
ncbi:MAG: hypothetical protein KDB88_03760, partial [Flavobacteriales bacterium]|nr:hypothetical protein [Flavobacteriales bacterium]